MHTNAAIIGVGQSAYTRRPEPGQSTHTFIRDAVVAALRDAEIDAHEIDGMALASFSLAPDAAVDIAFMDFGWRKVIPPPPVEQPAQPEQPGGPGASSATDATI